MLELVRLRPRHAGAGHAPCTAFPEERVPRSIHFLGQQAVQNLITLRFANGVEPIWSRDHIDHVHRRYQNARRRRPAPASTRTPAPTATSSSPSVPRARVRRDGAADDARGTLDRRGVREGADQVSRSTRPASSVGQVPGCARAKSTTWRRRNSPSPRESTSSALIQHAVLPAQPQAVGEQQQAVDDHVPEPPQRESSSGEGVRRAWADHISFVLGDQAAHDLVPGQGPGTEDHLGQAR